MAALLSDRTRASLLSSLLDGQSRSAGELALDAGVSPQVASNHLARLLDGGLLLREAQGRQRRYRLSSVAVATALEALAALGPAPRHLPNPAVPEGLRFARTCYDHLAGTLGVAVREALSGPHCLLPDEGGLPHESGWRRVALEFGHFRGRAEAGPKALRQGLPRLERAPAAPRGCPRCGASRAVAYAGRARPGAEGARRPSHVEGPPGAGGGAALRLPAQL